MPPALLRVLLKGVPLLLEALLLRALPMLHSWRAQLQAFLVLQEH